MKCDYCKEDPGQKPDSIVWMGFLDRDTDQYVCFGCRQLHYDQKRKTGNAHQYTEFPVPIPLPSGYPQRP